MMYSYMFLSYPRYGSTSSGIRTHTSLFQEASLVASSSVYRSTMEVVEAQEALPEGTPFLSSWPFESSLSHPQVTNTELHPSDWVTNLFRVSTTYSLP